MKNYDFSTNAHHFRFQIFVEIYLNHVLHTNSPGISASDATSHSYAWTLVDDGQVA